jgi:hypothetical protein
MNEDEDFGLGDVASISLGRLVEIAGFGSRIRFSRCQTEHRVESIREQVVSADVGARVPRRDLHLARDAMAERVRLRIGVNEYENRRAWSLHDRNP